MAADPSLFFQIAAGLIPVLLFGGVLTQVFRPKRLPLLFTPIAVVIAALAAEFIAIDEAVSASAIPSTFRTEFVGNVLAVLTTLTGVAVVWPWIGDWVMRHRNVSRTFMLIVTLGLAAGAFELNEGVLNAEDHRLAAITYCVTKYGLDHQLAELNIEDRIAGYDRQQGAIKTRLSHLKGQGSVETAQAKLLSAQLGDLRARAKAAENYETDLTLAVVRQDPHDVQDLTEAFGC